MNASDYTYHLPPEKIAFYPLPQRDASKLLVYKQGKIIHSKFLALTDHLPDNTFLFFNNTKVIPARLQFRKESGATIEIFLLNPILPSPLLAQTLASTGQCSWHCTIGNLKKWHEGTTLQKNIDGKELQARLSGRQNGTVDFTWSGGVPFAALIREAGETPLPPYIRREAVLSDQERYQTIYSRYEGAVAAPTAGLHFTDEIFSLLRKRKISHDLLTLHVSAGTFQPIKTPDLQDHVMHEEQIIITRKNIENLLTPGRFITAVGTTSMRTLESLYWYGVRLIREPGSEFTIAQDEPYAGDEFPSVETALKAVEDHMVKRNLGELIGETSIFIHPGYTFRICQGLITNFHQPASTLILLVAAFVGEDWRKIYDEALTNEYRFLSYGDSSLLIP